MLHLATRSASQGAAQIVDLVDVQRLIRDPDNRLKPVWGGFQHQCWLKPQLAQTLHAIGVQASNDQGSLRLNGDVATHGDLSSKPISLRKQPITRPVAGLLPAGSATDHHLKRAIQGGNLPRYLTFRVSQTLSPWLTNSGSSQSDNPTNSTTNETTEAASTPTKSFQLQPEAARWAVAAVSSRI